MLRLGMSEEFVKAEENREIEKIEEEKKRVKEVDQESGSPSDREREEIVRRMKAKVESLQQRMKHVREELEVANRIVAKPNTKQ